MGRPKRGHRLRPTADNPHNNLTQTSTIKFSMPTAVNWQCGNGTRCVALLARQLNLSAKKQLIWHSKGDRIHTRLLADRNPIVIETMLPAPSLDPGDVPFVSAAATNTDRLTVDGNEVEVTAVSTGNPHGVVLVDNVSNWMWQPWAVSSVPTRRSRIRQILGFAKL